MPTGVYERSSEPTDLQKVWLREYFACGYNATEAARRAGYKFPQTAGSIAKKAMSEEIQKHIEEAGMKAQEAIALLSAQARANIGDFLEVDPLTGEVEFDLRKADEANQLGVIKKIWHDARGVLRVEMYDAQKALELILKMHGMFTDRLHIDSSSPVKFKVVYGENGSDGD